MFKPINRHLLIEKVEEKKEECKSTILVPDDYKVKSSTHLSFTKEVTRVIKKWKFTPALKEGKPVTVRKIQPFLFGEQ